MSVNIAGSANLTGRVTVGANQIDPITDGLILYLDAGNPYSWTDSSITTHEWYDLSGRGRNTAFNVSAGMDTWGYADNGKKSIGALTFEGDRPAPITGVEFPNTSYSKCVWVNFNSIGYNSGPNYGQSFIQDILSGTITNAGSPHRLWYDGANIWANNNGGGGVKTDRDKNHPILPGTWYFVCVTWSVDAGWSLYIDGILEASNYDDTTPLYGTENDQIVKIGDFLEVFENHNYMYGMMSIAMMYNRVLSAQEVAYMYSKFAVRYKKNNPLFVGQSYGGGTIITINNLQNGHADGIVDLGWSSDAGNMDWTQPEAPLIELGTSNDITAGKSNTDTIIAYSSGYPNYEATAAWAARAYGNLAGYPDAFLPTLSYHTYISDHKDFFNKRLDAIGDAYNPYYYYWTSSETNGGEEPNPNGAWRVYYHYDDMVPSLESKNSQYGIRIAANFNI